MKSFRLSRPTQQEPPSYQPAASPGAVAIIIAALQVLIGLFWLAVGGLQLYAAATVLGAGSLAVTGVWNLFCGAVAFTLVSLVLKHHPKAVKYLVIQAAIGAGWGLIDGLWLGAWAQFLVLPLYIAVGVLAATNTDALRPQPVRRQAVVRPGPSRGGPAGVAGPLQPTASAAYCPDCGTLLAPGAGFCHVCGRAVAAAPAR